MRLLQHQSIQLLSQFGLKFLIPRTVNTVEEARSAFNEIAGPTVVKIQTPFGGRAKAGGVKTAVTVDEVTQCAQSLLGMEVNNFTVEQISLEPKVDFEREFYVGVTWDTGARLPVALLGLAGGIDVEASCEQQVSRRHVDPYRGLPPYVGREMAAELGIQGKPAVLLGATLDRLAGAFVALDATTLELNPLVLTADETLIALDAHLEIDDDAAGRQQKRLSSIGQIEPMPAGRPPTPLEEQAARIDSMDHRGVAGRLVEFDGDLGLIIGGGGASLTVFDAVRRYGGRPANYLEVGGNPTEEKVAALTELLLSKPGIRKLAVIMNVVNNTRADVMARGVVKGIRAAGRDPGKTICVFRIPGSWEQEAKDIMAAAGVEALGRDYSLDRCAEISVGRMNDNVA